MVLVRSPFVARRAMAVGCALALVGCSGSEGSSSPPQISAPIEVATTPDTVPATAEATTTTASAAATAATAATVPDDPVPGLDSDDPFCRAWSEFAGSFQAVALASSVGADPEGALRLEVAASGAVLRAIADLQASMPADVADERDAFIDGLLGPFAGRAMAARESLIAAGFGENQIEDLADLWLATLSDERSQDPDLVVVVPPSDQAAFDDAVASFSTDVAPIADDPNLVTDADAPRTLARIAATCPDQGILAGNDTVGE